MTYMCNKCMGHLSNVRSPRGGGALGGNNSLSYIVYFFDIITVNSLTGTPLELPLSVYFRKMFIVHVW